MTEMSPAEAVFFAAAALPTSERAAYLVQVCAGRDDLRQRVEQMLGAQPHVGDFLEPKPADAGNGTSAHMPDRLLATEEHSDPAARIGSILDGKYKLIEEIGEGGMGSVYMAQQTEPVKRAVAVKVIKAGMDSKAVLARFEAERQALAMMDHPNIAKVLDAGTTDGGRPFFVMELVKGQPITEFCDERKLTPRQRLELFVPVCQAIQHAHQKGVIHRDIKPSNVIVAMYDDRPVPKVIDFGVAKAAGQSLTDKTLMTGFGAVVGTPEYMSPEQANLNNMDIDTRSDVYSLGVLLYELLTGTTPVDRKSLGNAALLEILRIVRDVEAPRPSAKLSTIDTLPSVAANRGTEPVKLSKLVRGELDWIVMKCLEKDRSRRYETANALARDLERHLHDDVVEAQPPTAGYRLRKFARKHRTALTTATTIVLLLVAGVAVSTWQAVRATRAERLSQANEETARTNEAKAQEEARKAQASAEEAMASFGFIQSLLTEGTIKSAVGKRSLTLREVLDNSEQLFDSLASQPLAEARIHGLLAGLYIALNFGQSDEASMRHSKRALLLYGGVLGPDAPETLDARDISALAHRFNGQHEEAIRLYEESLRLRKAKFGSEDPKILEIMDSLAAMYFAALKVDRARSLYEEILNLRKTRQGPEHPDTLTTMTTLAGIDMIPIPTQKYPEAIRLYQEVLTIQRRKLAADDPALVSIMASLGRCLLDAGKPVEAEPLLRECLAVREKKERDGWTTLNTTSLLGAALLGQKKYSEAEPLLLAGYEGMKKASGVNSDEQHGWLIANLQWLVQLYEATGKKAKADEWRKKLEVANTTGKNPAKP
jgi:serine/threonine protein kinase/tetratricopeptide (TPR) repeat protein